ncbi:MAG: methylated-DNA--[Desulfovibrionaceae bacterium]|nr:methylated-DNA--[protein]-cysteine S-methyltransferase [Desulfovibrionaceae bacterium]
MLAQSTAAGLRAVWEFRSPLGLIVLEAFGDALCTVRFFDPPVSERAPDCRAVCTPIVQETLDWLEHYFAGAPLPPIPKLSTLGSAFSLALRSLVCAIPYGETRTYGELARNLLSSPRAVGRALSRNPIALIVPCHRVLGRGYALVGYAGGLARKKALLDFEKNHRPWPSVNHTAIL